LAYLKNLLIIKLIVII